MPEQVFTAKIATGGGFRNLEYICKYSGWAEIKVFPLHCEMAFYFDMACIYKGVG